MVITCVGRNFEAADFVMAIVCARYKLDNPTCWRLEVKMKMACFKGEDINKSCSFEAKQLFTVEEVSATAPVESLMEQKK